MKSRLGRRWWLIAGVLLVLSSGWAQDYKPAMPGYKFEFPRDEFNHEDYQTEWWYYTGNLKSQDGQRFGFELTFFRQGVARDANPDEWHVHDVWMAHLGLSDIGGKRFYHEERLNRTGPGIAGVDERSGLIWNGNWQAHISDREESLVGVSSDFGLRLNLLSKKPPVVQGQDGVSRKAAGVGQASHYYSSTRLETTGSIDVAGKTYRVEGLTWMDHEFFTGAMADNESGWDWLSVQFDDGTDLMLYRLRHKDGSIEPYSSGSYVDAQGHSRFLALKDFSMTPADHNWVSPTTKAVYPLRWHVSIPTLNLSFDVTTPLETQEMTSRFGPSYWEGAIDVLGSKSGATVHGVGYLELTGYAASEGELIPR